MTKEEIRSRRAFYSDHLTEVILPYWLPKIDHKHGVFLPAMTQQGENWFPLINMCGLKDVARGCIPNLLTVKA